eukprot:6210934-Pleurochrysis_carterae.AAC.1
MPLAEGLRRPALCACVFATSVRVRRASSHRRRRAARASASSSASACTARRAERPSTAQRPHNDSRPSAVETRLQTKAWQACSEGRPIEAEAHSVCGGQRQRACSASTADSHPATEWDRVRRALSCSRATADGRGTRRLGLALFRVRVRARVFAWKKKRMSVEAPASASRNTPMTSLTRRGNPSISCRKGGAQERGATLHAERSGSIEAVREP